MLAPSAVAFMQHIPYARVRIHSGAFFDLIGNSEEFPIKSKIPRHLSDGGFLISFSYQELILLAVKRNQLLKISSVLLSVLSSSCVELSCSLRILKLK